MKKLYVIAALLMATTSAHAGGMTLQINGERIRVEAPRNCNALSCIRITAPGYNGTLGNIATVAFSPTEDGIASSRISCRSSKANARRAEKTASSR